MTNGLPFDVLPGPPARPRQGRVLTAGGIVLAMAGMLLPAGVPLWLYGPDFFLAGAAVDPEPAETPLFWVALLVGLAAFYAGFVLIRVGRRMCARPAIEILAAGARAPVLFLRSFDDDDLVDPTPRMVPMGDLLRRRYEESIATALRDVGPMVSIGRPGSRLPELGGARLYVPDHAWQAAVTHLRQRAAAVVVVVGRSQGLWWEIVTSLREVPLARLLFVFPYVEEAARRRSLLRRWFQFDPARIPFATASYERMERERQARYRLFRERVQPQLKARLPQALGASQFLDFTDDGQARVLPLRRHGWHPVLMLTPSSARTAFDARRTLAPFVAKLAARPGRSAS